MSEDKSEKPKPQAPEPDREITGHVSKSKDGKK